MIHKPKLQPYFGRGSISLPAQLSLDQIKQQHSSISQEKKFSEKKLQPVVRFSPPKISTQPSIVVKNAINYFANDKTLKDYFDTKQLFNSILYETKTRMIFRIGFKILGFIFIIFALMETILSLIQGLNTNTFWGNIILYLMGVLLIYLSSNFDFLWKIDTDPYKLKREKE